MTSVIVPAHNEAAVIGRLLDGLLRDAHPDEFEVIVVVNGSTDDTARLCRERPVLVAEIDEASKYRALVTGDELATRFPRLYVDADVELDSASARALVVALGDPQVHAVAPERTLVLTGSSWAVRAYYRVWERLPAIREGLFGRGVLGVDEAGFTRIADRPDLIGDDLYLHSRFAPAERCIVAGSRSVVRGPRTVADLLRRRTRAAQANSQLGAASDRQTTTTSSSMREVLRIAAREPRLWPSLPVFVSITAYGRIRARWLRRRGRAEVWLRDESSRT